MAAKQIKKVAGQLTCPVCYEIYKKPKYLPCYHFYCEQCLVKLQKGNNITCPECMQISTVPTEGIGNLPNNFFINRIVDEFLLQEKVNGEEEVYCDICTGNNNPAVVLCFNCGEFLCDLCCESHKCSREFQGHKLILLKELRLEEKIVNLQSKPKLLVCQEHEIELNIYCETCEQLVCPYCTTKGHFEHDHNTAKKMASKHRVELDKNTKLLEKMINGLSEMHHTVAMTRDKNEEQTAEVDQQINRHYEQLQQQLLQQRDQLKKELHKLSIQNKKAASLQLEQIESTQGQLESMKELSNAIKNASDQETLCMKKQVNKDMKSLTDLYNKLSSELVELMTIEYITIEEKCKRFPQFGNVFYGDASPLTSEAKRVPSYIHANEKVEFLIVTKNADNNLCFKGGSKVMVEAESDSGVIIPVAVVDNKDSSYSASFVPSQAGKGYVSIIIKGKQIKGSPYSVSVREHSALNKPSKIINDSGHMGQPCGIAFGRDGIWAVVDQSNDCIYIYDGQDQLIRKFGSKGNCDGQFNFPAGLAFDVNNNIYVVDRYNHRVQKFDVHGNYLFQFSSRPLGNLYCPLGIVVHNDKVYVAEQMNHRISVFQCNGEFCHTIGQFGQLSEPYDLAVTDNNHLLVANFKQHCISIFTLDGEYIGNIGTWGYDRGQLCKPSAITVDTCGCILVTEDGNHRISVFNKDGNFVHCFGSKGFANGQFFYPAGIALDRNGCIYISDSFNQRIQIFDY